MKVKPWEVFKQVASASYATVGLDLDYSVQIVDGHAVLYFQQSVQNADWWHNFDFALSVYKNQENHMLIHHGYAKVWKSANDQIMAEFIEAVHKADKKPLIAGWSFGGAMAQLAAEDFHYRTGIRASVLTFGAPKIAGDKKTAEHIRCSGDFLQFAEHNDITSYMPPLPWYHHINLVKIGRSFNLFELFKPHIYHMEYDKEELYGGLIYDASF